MQSILRSSILMELERTHAGGLLWLARRGVRMSNARVTQRGGVEGGDDLDTHTCDSVSVSGSGCVSLAVSIVTAAPNAGEAPTQIKPPPSSMNNDGFIR